MDAQIERGHLGPITAMLEGNTIYLSKETPSSTFVLDLQAAKQLRNYLNRVIALNDTEVSA